MSSPTSPEHDSARAIVSFVRRSPRMNVSQRQALTRLSDRYVIDVARQNHSTSVAQDAHVDWEREFGRCAPLVVEIGSGTGDSLAAMAAARPDIDVVAFEVYERAVASTLVKLDAAQLTNVRVVVADGVQAMRQLFAPDQLSEVWTFFPDPWHKLRHHKRRLVSPEFAALVANRLSPEGLWRLATDWSEYAQWMRAILDDTEQLTNVHQAPGWAPRPSERPITRFERRGMNAGRQIFDLVYRKTPITQTTQKGPS